MNTLNISSKITLITLIKLTENPENEVKNHVHTAREFKDSFFFYRCIDIYATRITLTLTNYFTDVWSKVAIH